MFNSLVTRSTLALLTGIGCTLAITPAQAASLTGKYSFDNGTPTATVTTDNPSDISFSDWSFGSGLEPYRGSNFTNSGNPDGAVLNKSWTPPEAPTPNDNYYQFSLAPTASRSVTITDISFDAQRSSKGPLEWRLDATIGNSAAIIIGTGNHNASAKFEEFSIAGVTELENVTDLITFRLFGLGAETDGGTWRIDNFQLGGTIASAAAAQVPEANSVPTPALLPAIGAMAFKLRKRLKTA